MARLPLRADDPEYLGGYELLSRLGSGGMGTVFLARSPRGRPVAIKAVRADFTRDAELLGRFRSEVARARQVPPFCTAEVLDADLDHDPPYLVFEYVDGPNLCDVVDDQGPLAPGPLHSAALGIATALAAIHGAGVIHRDLKPDNVLFALGGVKVIDFGIARPIDATSHHTRTDQMVGTIAYMAPERFDEAPTLRVGPAADIFAWGAVVAFAATGRTPFAGESTAATAARILTRPPNLAGLPAPLRDIVAWTLTKEPEDRPTARELVELLLADEAPAPVNPAPVAVQAGRPRGRGLKRAGVAVAAVAVLLIAGLLGHHLQTRGPADAGVPAAIASPSAPATGGQLPPATPEDSLEPSPVATREPERTTSPITRRSSAATARPGAAGGQVNTSGRDLALNAPATASSVERGDLGPSFAVDGNPATRWSSGFSDPQWLRVDLGARWQISEITLDWENAHATAYRVEVSGDGTTWKPVYSTGDSQGGDVTVEVAKLPARYVRMYGTARSTAYGYSLLELDVR